MAYPAQPYGQPPQPYGARPPPQAVYMQPQPVMMAAPVVVQQPLVQQQMQQQQRQSGATGGGAFQPKYRKALTRKDSNRLEILHQAENAPPRQCCGKGNTAALEESTYTWVCENRVEWNRPVDMGVCCPTIRDVVGVAYFDQFDVVDNVRPCCSDCRGTGEVLVFKDKVLGCCTCDLFKVMKLRDAATTASAIRQARKDLLMRVGGEWD